MKKILSLFVAFIVILAISVSAFADTPQYKSSKAFVKMMDENGYEYEFYGKGDSDSEFLFTDFEGDIHDYVEISAIFPDTEDEVTLYSFEIISFEKSDYLTILETVNELNSNSSYCCFYVDNEDNTVNASWDVLLGEKDAKDISDIAFHTFLDVVDIAYETLAPFEK